MSPETIFNLHLILGYVAWLLCFGVYFLPRLKSMDPVAAQRAIATLHSFRFFGLVFILPGVVGPNLPAAGFATSSRARPAFPQLPSLVQCRRRGLRTLILRIVELRTDGIAPHLSCVVNNFPRDGRRATRK